LEVISQNRIFRCYIFLTLTRLVVVLKFINFRFTLFTRPLGDFQKDHQQKGDIEIAYVSTKEQLADIFTKPLDEKPLANLGMS
jgi:hypothetical protein